MAQQRSRFLTGRATLPAIRFWQTEIDLGKMPVYSLKKTRTDCQQGMRVTNQVDGNSAGPAQALAPGVSRKRPFTCQSHN